VKRQIRVGDFKHTVPVITDAQALQTYFIPLGVRGVAGQK